MRPQGGSYRMNTKLRPMSYILTLKFISFLLLSVLIGLNFSCAAFNVYKSESYEEYYGINKSKKFCDKLPSQAERANCIDELLCKDLTGINKEVCLKRNYANFRANEYSDEFTKLGGVNTFLFDLPIIGLAIATGAVAIFSGNTNLIAALALGTAGTVALRAYSNSSTKAGYFLSAMKQSDCVLSTSTVFLNVSEERKNLKDQKTNIGYYLTNAQIVFADPQLKDGDPKKALGKAIDAANAALKLQDDAEEAISGSAENIKTEVKQIYTNLQSKLKDSIPEVNTIVAAFQTSLQKIQETKNTTKEVDDNTGGAQELLDQDQPTGTQESLAPPPRCDSVPADTEINANIKARTCTALLITPSNNISNNAPRYIDADSKLKACIATP